MMIYEDRGTGVLISPIETFDKDLHTVFSPIDGPPIGVSRTFTSYGLRNRFFVFFIKYFCVSRQELQNKWSVRFLGPGNAEKHHFGDLELMSKLDYATLL